MSEHLKSEYLKGVAAVLLGALLGGCAGIPTSGVPETGRAEGSVPAQNRPEVRVVAPGPRAGDSPLGTVSGFLEASGTVEENFATARKFLTPAAGARWKPGAGVTIYDHTDVLLSERSGSRVLLSATADGSVDDQGVFSAKPPGQQTAAAFTLVRVGGDWRIDSVPAGLLVSRQDFDREYVQLDAWFLARPPHSPVLVPDPVYVTRSSARPTAMAETVLRGPSRWLSGVAMSAAPAGAKLAGPITQASGIALVRLNSESVPDDGVQRDLMLAQLVMTLTQDPEITSVEVQGPNGYLTFGDAGTPQLRRFDVTPYLPGDLRQPTAPAYFVREGIAYTAEPAVAQPIVQGPFAPDLRLAEIAVTPGGPLIAGIAADRRTLWTARIEEPRRLAVRARGSNLRSASFDSDGNLWVLEGSGKKTVVRRYPPSGPAVQVTISGFEARQITRLRVAADGVRLAMVLSSVEGTQVYIAQASESTTGVAIAALRRVAAGLLQPRSVDWADPGTLVVLATEKNAQVQPFSVFLSGPIEVLAPPLADMTEVSIAPPDLPMIAATAKDQIWRLRGDTWVREGPGTAPTYPG